MRSRARRWPAVGECTCVERLARVVPERSRDELAGSGLAGLVCGPYTRLPLPPQSRSDTCTGGRAPGRGGGLGGTRAAARAGWRRGERGGARRAAPACVLLGLGLAAGGQRKKSLGIWQEELAGWRGGRGLGVRPGLGLGLANPNPNPNPNPNLTLTLHLALTLTQGGRSCPGGVDHLDGGR